jgi:hypothetical protein
LPAMRGGCGHSGTAPHDCNLNKSEEARGEAAVSSSKAAVSSKAADISTKFTAAEVQTTHDGERGKQPQWPRETAAVRSARLQHARLMTAAAGAYREAETDRLEARSLKEQSVEEERVVAGLVVL